MDSSRLRLLAPLASLRLTVVLFLLAIFIVFAGTLVDAEIHNTWQMTRTYFRMDFSSPAAVLHSAFPWIELRVFLPVAFFPELARIPAHYGFFVPNGWLIGFAMFLNLSAAHLIRFRIQARGSRLWAGLVGSLVGLLLMLAVIAAGREQTIEQLRLFTDWPSLRILWLLTQCTIVSLVLLGACALLFRKRAGIVLLHLGVGLLMIGELLVGLGAVEGQMRIAEGQTVNYTIDPQALELAFIDRSDSQFDDIAAIPQSRFVPGEIVRDVQLPFDIEVVRFMANSRLRAVSEKDKNPATAGIGLTKIAEPVPANSTRAARDRADMPAAYVRLLDRKSGKPTDTYLVSFERWAMGKPERIDVGRKQYELYLRYKHMYKPYSLHLIDVRKDEYVGTDIPKGFSSTLRLVDPARHVDRRVRIWMNNPLRFSGETLYQSDYERDPETGEESTGLQIVTNRSWRIPYLACMMTAVGMLVQFWLVLTRFLKRRQSGGLGETRATQTPRVPGKPPTNQQTPGSTPPLIARSHWTDWAVPLAVVVLAMIWLASKAYQPTPKPQELDLPAFGRLPVMYEGRVKPFDTLARNSLRMIADQQTFVDEHEKPQPAVRWLLDVITDADAAMRHKVFRIHNLDVLETLGLKPRKGFRYALDEFRDQLEEFDKQVRQARETPEDERDLYNKKVLEMDYRLRLFILLRESFRVPELRPGHISEDIARERNRITTYSRYDLPLAVPVQLKKNSRDASPDRKPWRAYSDAAFNAMAVKMVGREPNPATMALAAILGAYVENNSRKFNQEVDRYHQYLENHPPSQWHETKTNFEVFHNHLAPFYHLMFLYVVAFLLACLAWFGWSKPLNNASFWLILLTLTAHTAALGARMYISGRPPVTTLYSSALFVGWGAVILGLILERVFRIGVGNVVASVAGFTALLIGFLLTTAITSFKGDTFEVLRAVLDTDFWLATHVTCITLGYATTFVAGILGIVYVLRGAATRSLSPDVGRQISRMIYGTVCFAIFFSFVGTVLGGLWADDSWGRFWGWDAKENGALIIVLWNALVLHALWSRLVRQRGLAVLVIVGNVVTAWSWFGVNQLQVGLHSYGFTEGVLLALGWFVALHLIPIAIGLLPKTMWRSQPESN